MAKKSKQTTMPTEETILRTRADGVNVVLMVGQSPLTPEGDPSRTLGLFIGVQCVFHAEYVHPLALPAITAALRTLGESSACDELGAIFEDEEGAVDD